MGRDHDGGISFNRALVLTPAAAIAPFWFYHRQVKPMPVVFLKDDGLIGALLLADKAPFVPGPGKTLIPRYYGTTYPGVPSLGQTQRADGSCRTDQSAHVTVLITGSMPKVHPGGPESLQTCTVPVGLQGIGRAGPHALTAARATPQKLMLG